MGGRAVTKKVLSYIEEHPDKDLSLEEIAEALHYSRFYIARAFKENTGYTLYKYIRSRRLNEAARKLAETTQPVVEIALEAGYGSQQAFATAFRHEYLCTPQEYRRRGIFMPKQKVINGSMDKVYTSVSSVFEGGRIAA